MSYKGKTVITYTFLHFFVDFTTVYLVSSILLGKNTTLSNRGYIIILYNLLAFAFQLPLGIISDIIGKNRFFAATGCLLCAASYPAFFISPWLSCILGALGNGAFHIGAGSEILSMSMPRTGLCGLFVSSGALGVYLAYKASGNIFSVLCPAMLTAFFIYLVKTKKFYNPKEKDTEIRYKNPGGMIILAIVCFMLTIILRSLLGMVMKFSWQSSSVLAILFIAGVTLGKCFGGFFGDKFGYIKTAAISLFLSAILFVFSFNVPVAGILGVFFFNMTMPLTLTAIASVCEGKYGFSFGMTTFALALGFIPTVFGAGKLFSPVFLICTVIFSLIFIISGYMLLKGAKKCG